MIRIASTICIVGVVSAASVSAEPLEEFGARGRIILSADRLSPFLSYTRIQQDQGGGNSVTTSTTSFSPLWTASPQNLYDIPHFAFDYVVVPHLTVGGYASVTLPASSTQSTTQNGTTTSQDGAKLSALGIGARGGYLVALTPRLWFWPRAGLSYTRESTTSTALGQGNELSVSVSQIALNLEPQLALHLVPHFALTLGLVFDIPLTGTQHSEFTLNQTTISTDTDSSQLHIGFTAGLLGWW